MTDIKVFSWKCHQVADDGHNWYFFPPKFSPLIRLNVRWGHCVILSMKFWGLRLCPWIAVVSVFIKNRHLNLR